MKMEKKCKLLSAALLAAVMMMVAACSKDDDGPHLSVEATGGTMFTASGGSIDVSVTSDAVWRIDKTAGEASDWLSVNITQGKESRYVKVYAKANTTITSREAALTFVCMTDEGVRQSMTFSQAGLEPKLTVTPITASLSPYVSSLILRVESNMSWTAKTDCDWLTLSATDGQGNRAVTANADENNGDDDRKAIVTFTSTENQQSLQVEVTQQGMAGQLYREPMTRWGAGQDDVRAYMNEFDIVAEDASRLAYSGKHSEVLTSYSFDGGKLWNAVVALDSAEVEKDVIENHLKNNKYLFSGTSMGGISVYKCSDVNTLLLLDNVSNSQAYFVRYNNYDEPFKAPYTSWLTPLSQVRTTMAQRGYEVLENGTTNGKRYIAYLGTRLEYYSVYHFNVSLALNEVDVALDPEIVSFDHVCSYLCSKLSYRESQNLASNYGNVYENGETVALVLKPQYTDTRMVETAFISYRDAYANVSKARGRNTRGDMSDLTLNPDNKLPKDLLWQLIEKGLHSWPSPFLQRLNETFKKTSEVLEQELSSTGLYIAYYGKHLENIILTMGRFLSPRMAVQLR